MKVAWLTAIVLGWVLLSVGLVVAAVAPADEAREKLETAVPEGIRRLEAKEYATFLKNFVPPDDFKKITGMGSLDEIAKQFGESKAPRLLAVLKAIKDTKPTLDPNGQKATFELKEAVEGKKSITFLKIEKYWYIQGG